MNDFILEAEVGKDERRDMCMSKLIKLYTSNMSSYFMSIISKKNNNYDAMCVCVCERQRERILCKKHYFKTNTMLLGLGEKSNTLEATQK